MHPMRRTPQQSDLDPEVDAMHVSWDFPKVEVMVQRLG